MAKFLQETLRESGLKANAHIVGSDAFKEFFRKVCPPILLCHISKDLPILLGPFNWGITLSAGCRQRREAFRR